MSHIVSIRTQVRDPAALQAACLLLGLQAPVQGTARLYTNQATGQIVQLLGWTYPVVIDTGTGQVQYDNYNGAWGEQALLGRLLQAYAAEKTRIEARKTGHTVTEQTLPDGSLRLTLQETGRCRLKIEITISPQGEVTVQTKGYTGSSCQAATKAPEESLGLKGKEKLTAEYYQAQTTQTQQRLQQ